MGLPDGEALAAARPRLVDRGVAMSDTTTGGHEPDALTLVEMSARYESHAGPVADHRLGVQRLPADVVARHAVDALTWDREITADLSRARHGLVREALRAGVDTPAVAAALGVALDDVSALDALGELPGRP